MMKTNRELYLEAMDLIGKEVLEVKQRDFLLRLINKHKRVNINSTLQRVNSGDIEEIVQYLNKCTSKEFRATTPETKALIRARMNEGFRVDDFKKVIDIKCRQWLKGEQFKYLRPKTLFGSKFEGYLQEWIVDNKKRMYRNQAVEVACKDASLSSKEEDKKAREWVEQGKKLLSQATPQDWQDYLAQEKLFKKLALTKGINDNLVKNLYIQFLKNKKLRMGEKK